MNVFKHDWQLSDAACSRIRSIGIKADWNVLEYGPGHSTWVIQEAIKPLTHTCIDEPGEWGKEFVKKAVGLPINYEVKPLDIYFDTFDRLYDLILVDGPAAIGSRGAAYDAVLSMSHSHTVIIIDDTHRQAEAELVERIRNSGGWKLEVIPDTVYKQRQTAFLWGN